MTIKQSLYNYCLQFINNRLTTCKDQIDKIQESLLSETKSTAGDKHETGRAMLHLEREKAGQQLATIKNLKETLYKINPTKTSKTVCLGSIVYTSANTYYIAISVGEITIDTTSFFAISPSTPIGKLLLGKTVNDKITFKNSSFTIITIL